MAISQSDGSIILSTKVDTTGLKKNFKEMTKMAGKAFLSISALAGATALAITKMAVSAYADYEQLVGGVETLFGESSKKLISYAHDAFYTAGVSANDYMRQVTSFSASLIRSTGGDTEKAVEVANMALIDMSDNVNKMGSSMESVQLAYQGFAKQQYMLLDNLKLGYGGTKTEMERLLKDAEAITGVKYDISNLADVYLAIHAIQEQLGITGTTAKEAEKTISGSANMTKAAWQDVLIALAGGGDIDKAMNNLVYSITKYLENIVPVIERILMNIGVLIESSAPMLIQVLVKSIIRSIPTLVSAIYQMILGVFNGIILGVEALFTGGTEEVTKQLENSTEGMSLNVEGASDGMEQFNEETEKAVKEANKMVAGFDELNTIQKDNKGGKNQNNTYANNFGVTKQEAQDTSKNSKKISKDIQKSLLSIMGVVATALVAVGIILCATGNLKWGIGFIIAGAGLLGVTMATLKSDAISQEVKDALSNVLIISGIVAIVLGILLICTGVGAGYGFGLLALGATTIVTSVYFNADSIAQKMEGVFGGILAIVGVVAIVIGVLLCCASMWGIGIGAIALGATTVVGMAVINWDSIKNALKSPLGKAIAVVGVVAIVLGVLLCMAGLWGLGLGLIALGGVAVATVVTVNWDTILSKLKSVWASIKEWWNSKVAKYFTASWWGNLAKNAINGFLKWIVNGLNKLVDKLNSFGFNLPKVLGGGRVGFNVKRLDVPQLAKGAVIPPNREFLAVLGDQKHGTNIEAPLDTIVQAFNMALQGNNNGFNGRIEVPVIIDGREVLRAVRNNENAVGTQTVFGGFANAY